METDTTDTTTIECYRFVEPDLTSVNGDVTWRIGEWNRTTGPVRCCANGLHVSPTPRDSLRDVYGRRWFLAEARGEISRQTHKFAASEMRLVEEIPAAALRRFAVRCAQDALDHLERRHPVDARARQCLRAAEGFLDGTLHEADLLEARRAAGGLAASGAPIGADTGRAVAATIAASRAADGDAASWASAAAAAAYAAHAAADAIEAAEAHVAVYAPVHNVAAGIAASHTADRAATAAHTAAAAGAGAHAAAAAVAAARGTYAADTAADPYFAAFSEFSAHPADTHYLAQNAVLLALIGDARADRV
ncbi:DUF7666 domain-containing protein [Streptomyces prunicolor]|uniref:DUF7666 domain-containing protein n=1 Tax=Streptomyces prunicolor TaxID=67348 RepID=UPI0033C9BEAE